jgi:phenylalanyl-tRNA synthetase beta subunit
MSFGTLNLPMNLIQLLDRQVLNELGVQLVVFTTTVNARYQAKRGILNFKNLALLNTNNQDGSFLALKLLSSLTRKTLVFLSW